MDQNNFCQTIESILVDFMKSRERTMHILVEIWLEMQTLGKQVNSANIFTKSISALTGIASLGFLIAAPITGGLSAAGSVALVSVSGATAAASLGATVYQKIVEKGLLLKVKVALDEDRKASERLHAAAGALRDLATIACDTTSFLIRATQMGVTTAKEVNSILMASNVSSNALDVAANVSKIVSKVNKCLKVAAPVLVVISIPIDILSIIYDIKDCKTGNYSDTAVVIWDKVEELQKEYLTAKEVFKNIVNAMADEYNE